MRIPTTACPAVKLHEKDPARLDDGSVLGKPTLRRATSALLGTCLSGFLLTGCGSSFMDSDGASSSELIAEAKGAEASQGRRSENAAIPSRFANAAESNTPGAVSDPIPSQPPLAQAPSPAPSPSPSPAPAPAPKPSPSPAPAPSPSPSPSPSPTPVPSPAPAPVSGTINSLDTIVNDMKLMNDVALAGVPTNYGFARGPGHVIMGNDPRGTNTPSWWQVNNQSYKSSTYWNGVMPWLVVFDGVGNMASNTRVQLRNLKLYIKSKSTGRWNLINGSTGVSGENYPKSLQGADVQRPDVRTESDGSTSVLPPGGNLLFHGWGGGIQAINGSDVGALFVTLQARLIKNNASGTDDRAKAKYLIHVGGDYYPTVSTRVTDLAPAYYFPGIGTSRAKLVSNDWQAFNFSTIDVGVEDPGGGVMTEAQLRAAPPPLE